MAGLLRASGCSTTDSDAERLAGSGCQQAARFLQHFAAPEYQLPLTAADLVPEDGRAQAGQQNGAHKGRLFRLLENLGLAADGQAKAQGGYLALVNIGQLGNDAVIQRLVAVAPGLFNQIKIVSQDRKS